MDEKLAKRYGDDVIVHWHDKKRYFGMPISFTHYAIIEKPNDWTKLVVSVGLLSTYYEEVHVYRIDDLSVERTLSDKVFGVGTVIVKSNDTTQSVLPLVRIKYPLKVRRLITELVQRERKTKSFGFTEFHA